MKFKKFLFVFILIASAFASPAQEVKNTSYITSTGEKVLRLEMIVPLDLKTAWEYFTKDELLQKWIAPLAHIELRSGGYILTNYDPKKSLTDSSSIKLDIINYLEGQLLTLKVNLNNNFPPEAKNTDQHLQEVLQFHSAGEGRTKIISSMIGWGKGEAWDKTYDFFEKGNTWTYREFYKAIQ